MNTSNFNPHPISILDVSHRTVEKIIRRARLGCGICAWNEATCDIHHALPKVKGGSDAMNNLVCVCPNCHRKLHQFKERFQTMEQLSEITLDKTFPNWFEFYNKSPKCAKVSSLDPMSKKCPTCDALIPWDNLYCSLSCAGKARGGLPIFTKEDVDRWTTNKLSLENISQEYKVNKATIYRRLKNLGLADIYAALKRENKMSRVGQRFGPKAGDLRPSKEALTKLVWEKPIREIAKIYTVSDTAVTKWCKKHLITKPPAGYWLTHHWKTE